MKTTDELNALKEEVETLNEKLVKLTEEELEQVTGGNWWPDYYGEDGYFKGGLDLRDFIDKIGGDFVGIQPTVDTSVK